MNETFEKSEILKLANTEAGKHLISDGRPFKYAKEERIVKITPQYIKSFIGTDGKRNYFRTRFFFNDEVYRSIALPFQKIQEARNSEIFKWRNANFYKEFLHHSFLERGRYPDVFLTTTEFSTFLGGAGRFDEQNSGTWAIARAATSCDFVFATYEPQSISSPRIQRVMIPVTTSSIPITDNIDSDALEFNGKNEGGYTNSKVHLIQTTQSNTSTRITSDYNNVLFVSGGSATITTSGFLPYTITGNATSLTWINAAGNSLLGVICDTDLTNSAPGVNAWITMSSPNLVVIHSSGIPDAVWY